MRQWEYKFENLYSSGPLEVGPDKPLDRTRWLTEQLKGLNDFGAAGWEVVAILGPPHEQGSLLLKRESRSEG